jgi:hypothetical protein
LVTSGSLTLRGNMDARGSLVLCLWPLCGSECSGGRRVPLALVERYQ